MPQASQGERPGLQNLEWYRNMRDKTRSGEIPRQGSGTSSDTKMSQPSSPTTGPSPPTSANSSQNKPNSSRATSWRRIPLTTISFGTW